MRLSFIAVCLLVATLVSSCQSFNDLFVFREEQKHLVDPIPAEEALNIPQRLRPPLPVAER